MAAAGKLREQVVLLTELPPTTDELGGLVPGSTVEVPLWARVEMLAAKEDLINNVHVYRQPYKVTVRYRSDLTATSAIRWQGKLIPIISVVADERKTELLLRGVCNL